MLRDWITVREAAEIVGVAPVTIRHAIRAKRIEATKFGRAVLVSRVSAEEYRDSPNRRVGNPNWIKRGGE